MRYLLSALVSAVMLHTSASAGTLQGRVVAVADGDTATLQTADGIKHRIRLDGIDAPERTQPYAQICRRQLSELVAGRAVIVESDKMDRFGRVVGIMRTDQNADVGLVLIRKGCAWHFSTL